MRKTGKKFAAARQQVPDKPHSIEDAVPLMQKVKFAKFDETVEIAMRLGVDPKHADQMVRGTVVLPHGLGKTQARAGDCRRGQTEGCAAGRRRLRRRRRAGREDPGRLDRLRRGRRDARHDARGRQAGKGARPARPDAEPEDRHRDAGHRQGGQGNQGGQGRVPRRQDRHHPRPDRQGVVPVAEPDRERARAGRQRRDAPSRRRRRASSCEASRCPRRWARASRSTRAT